MCASLVFLFRVVVKFLKNADTIFLIKSALKMGPNSFLMSLFGSMRLRIGTNVIKLWASFTNGPNKLQYISLAAFSSLVCMLRLYERSKH